MKIVSLIEKTHTPIKILSEFLHIGSILNQKQQHEVFFSSLESKMFICQKDEKIFQKAIAQKSFTTDERSNLSQDDVVISIFVTSNCNMRCNYCYAYLDKKKEPHLKKVQDLDTVISFIKNYSKLKKIKKIRFQGGGEPTLYIQLIKKVVEFCKSHLDIQQFEIQSNFSFNREIAFFLAEQFTEIYASIDGPKIIQKIHRNVTPKQHHIIEDNLKYIVERSKKALSVKCTVSKFSNDKLLEIIDYFSFLGIHKVVFEPIFEMGKGNIEDKPGNTPPMLDDFLKMFIQAKKYALIKNVFAFCCFMPLETSGFYYCGGASCSPCLTTDNYISTCDEHFINKDDDIFIIGKYQKKKDKIILNEKKINYLRSRNVFNLKSCGDCFLKWSCRGQCLSRTLHETGDIFKVDQNKCQLIKKYAEEYLLFFAKESINGTM